MESSYVDVLVDVMMVMCWWADVDIDSDVLMTLGHVGSYESSFDPAEQVPITESTPMQ